MSKPIEQIEADALGLPASERARLAQRLIESLDGDLEEDPTEVELAWQAEIQRRLEEHRSGQVQPISGDEVFARVRARLR